MLVLTAAVLLSAAACGGSGGGGGGGKGPTTVNLNAVYVSASTSNTATKCIGTFEWRLEPLSLVGTTGTDAPVKETVTYDVSISGGRCQYQWGVLGLRPGTWRIANQFHVCDVDLKAGGQSVTMTQGRAGCDVFQGEAMMTTRDRTVRARLAILHKGY